MIDSHTNSSLSTFRLCPRKFQLRYIERLTLDAMPSEALSVGDTWHAAFEAFGFSIIRHGASIQEASLAASLAIDDASPSLLWREKLRRLFAAWFWYWRDVDDWTVTDVEDEFDETVSIAGGYARFRGKRDERIQLKDGRVGILERKTTSEDISAGAPYWERLKLGTQVGIYGIALHERPSVIVYDVTRKPTINPKNLTAAEVKRMKAEVKSRGHALYFGETFMAADVEHALEEGRESIQLYGARLTSDIGNRPDYYFARREVPRTDGDYAALADDLAGQVSMLRHAERIGIWHRNPDSCQAFGSTCEFFGICSVNGSVQPGGDVPPRFRRRDKLHPELS